MADIFEATFNDQQVLKGLDDIEKKLTEVGKAAQSLGDTTAKAIQETSAAAQQSASVTQKTAEEMAAIRARFAAQEAKTAQEIIRNDKLAAEANASNAKFIEQQAKAATQATNEAIVATEKQATATKGLAGAMGVLRGAISLVKGAFVALGIPVLIALFEKLVKQVSPVKDAMSEIQKVMAGLGAALEVIAKRFVLVFSAISKAAKGDFKGAMADAKASVDDFAGAVIKAYDAGSALEEKQQALNRQFAAFNVLVAKQTTQLERLRNIYDDTTKSIEERTAASKRIAEIEQSLSNQAIGLAKQNLALARENAALKGNDADSIEQIQNAEISLQDAIQKRDKVEFEAGQRRRELEKEALEFLKEQQKLLEQLRGAARPEGIEGDLAAADAATQKLIKSANDAIEALNTLEKKQALSPEQIARREELISLRGKIEEKGLSELVDIAAKYAEKDAEIERQLQEGKEKLAKEDQARLLQQIEDQKTLRDQQIDITEEQARGVVLKLEASKAKEKEIAETKLAFDKLIQKARLESELKFQNDLLAATDKGDVQRIEEIRNNIALLQEQIKNVSGQQEGKRGILEILGLDDPETLSTVRDTFGELLATLQKVADARVKAADAAVNQAEKEVDAAQKAYDEQLALKRQGLANDSDLTKKQLEDAKKAQDAAIEQKKKALIEESKIKRAAILVDSIQQGQSLITASAKIFDSLAGIPFVGIPLAIGAVGLLLGAFAKAKIEALKLAAPPKLRKGKKITGQTHEQGGELVEVERGEWVIGTQHSKEHDAFLENLNKGEYAGMDLAAIAGEARRNPVTRNAIEVRMIEAQRKEANAANTTAALIRAYQSGSGEIVQAIRSKPDIYPFKQGYIKETKSGNIKTREIVQPE